MKCQICHKNDAQIVFTQIINNEKIVMQICTECAKKKGLSIEFEAVDSLAQSAVSFGNDAVEMVASSDDAKDEAIPDLTCDVCGLTFAEFRKTGLFGCDNCHEAFESEIRSILKDIHGVDVHLNNNPPDTSRKEDIKVRLKKLRAELKHCVEMEEYERAAELRDSIEEIQRDIRKK